uniref:Uncharacterized protein n=1 Tax=Salmonella phage PMBT35 TaxID=3137287 RepID=A0AAU8BV83_9VIRU
MSDYGSIIGVCENGCLADSGLHNIDGGAVNPATRTMIGKAVRVIAVDSGVRIVNQEFNASDNPYGVVLLPIDCGCDPSYEEGEPISVVTCGRVWVSVPYINEAPNFMDTVFVLSDGTLSQHGTPTKWFFTGDFIRRGHGLSLAVVQL